MVRAHDEFGWDAYFEREDKSVFQRLISLHRRMFISRAVRYYARKHFPPRGVFLEAGAGTSQSSSRIETGGRTLIALDYNYQVLARHNCLPYRVQGRYPAAAVSDGEPGRDLEFRGHGTF